MNRPIAVLISDIHYNLTTLPLADAALRQAISKANELRVPLIVAGDLHDTKANLRGECVNALIETFKLCDSPPYILVGNHDRLNEKASEHSLNFLSPYAMIIDHPVKQKFGYLIPYYHDADELRTYLKTIPEGSQIIMHQGLQGSEAGEYYVDKSSLTKDDVKDFRVISGHYHYRQDIKAGRARQGAVGLFSYIGNPFTLNFGESNDPEKGYQILMNDGTLEFVPTNLRKHVIIDNVVSELVAIPYLHKPGDLLWFKLRGTKEELLTVSKQLISDNYGIEDDFKLDLILTDSELQAPKKELSNADLLDTLIDSTNNSDERKSRLKELWRHLGS